MRSIVLYAPNKLSTVGDSWILSLIAVDSLGSLTRWQSSSPPPPPLPAAAAALWTPPPAVCLERGLAGATASLSVSDASTPPDKPLSDTGTGTVEPPEFYACREPQLQWTDRAAIRNFG
ncbi:hypothetical protein TYRP_018755 [Tyrophagus putrescentiae]|nr:hypothetical protein TYRP_018755 [Tyrophagus putrescentiae]